MKTVDLKKENLDLEAVISLAKQEPILLLTSEGEEFFISEADDFEKEVEALRASEAFQRFLDERSERKDAIPLDEIEQEIEAEMQETT
jgi:hypothetical protein